MLFPVRALRVSNPLLLLSLWITFVGAAVWMHAQHSQQPPLWDAYTYYLKAYNFWSGIERHDLFNPLNLIPSVRPPGTILMSYPFGFDVDFRGFYFRSVFFPIALLCGAVLVAGYRRELDRRSQWYLVLLAAFLSSLPCFYTFELVPNPPATGYWGLVDNFLGGVAALAAATALRSVWSRSLPWLGLSVALAALCLLIKPSGILVMLLIGVTWSGLAGVHLRADWGSADRRSGTLRWFLRGLVIFAVIYLLVLAATFQSDYLSPANMAFGNASIAIMKAEFSLSWPVLRSTVHNGLGYFFVAWLCVTLAQVGYFYRRVPSCSDARPRSFLTVVMVCSGITFAVGAWFWIFGSGGVTQIRYFTPFLLMAVILAIPVTLNIERSLSLRQRFLLFVLLVAPIINLGMLLPQRQAPLEWQKWTGVSLASGGSYPVIDQARDFTAEVKRKGHDVTLYSMSMGLIDGDFTAVIDHARFVLAPMPIISIIRTLDWQRPTTYRKEEMLGAGYWLFRPVRDPQVRQAALSAATINTYQHEEALFQAWATQLTTDDGIIVLSDTTAARVLRLVDATRLEAAFDALVTKHRWRGEFIAANPRRRVSEGELRKILAVDPPGLEDINFGDRFYLRALSVRSAGDEARVRIWWRPRSALAERDWVLFLHLLDEHGNIVLNNSLPLHFTRSVPSLGDDFLFDHITFKSPASNVPHRLAIGFVRPNNAPLPADKGTRDWDNRRVLVAWP